MEEAKEEVRRGDGNLHLKNNVTGIKGQNAPIVRKKSQG